MKDLFSHLAARFARSVDGSIDAGCYVRGRLFVAHATAALPARGDLLDYGCGPGRIGLLLAQAGFRVYGVDTSDGMIAEARALDRQGLDVRFDRIAEAAEALPPLAYDAIVCSSVIEYVDDAAGLLRGFRRALRPGGVLLISYANRSSLLRRLHDLSQNPMGPAQRHVWDWPGFRQLLAGAGFRAEARPKFFEWQWDWSPWAAPLRYLPWLGSIGLVVARPVPLPRALPSATAAVAPGLLGGAMPDERAAAALRSDDARPPDDSAQRRIA